MQDMSNATLNSNETEIGLACRCPKMHSGVRGCHGGRSIYIRTGYWAGSLRNNNIPEPPDTQDYLVFPTNESKFQGPDGFLKWCKQLGGEFGVVPCENGKCLAMNGNLSWNLELVSPCDSSLNTTGPLCGMCQGGMSLILASRVWNASVSWRSVLVQLLRELLVRVLLLRGDCAYNSPSFSLSLPSLFLYVG